MFFGFVLGGGERALLGERALAAAGRSVGAFGYVLGYRGTRARSGSFRQFPERKRT